MHKLEVKRVRQVARAAMSDGEPVTIGRSTQNELVLPHTKVSRRHCVIEIHEGAPRLRDLGSSHGTRVNGRTVSEAPLHDGDVIGVGPFEIRFSGEPRPAADDAPAAASSSSSGSLHPEAQAVETELRAKVLLQEQRVRTLRAELERAMEDAEDQGERQRQQVEQAEAARDEARQQVESLAAERQALQERLEAAESALESARQRREQVARELETKSAAFDKLTELAASLRHRLEEVETANREHTARVSLLQQTLGHMEAGVDQLHETSQRLGAVQRSVRALEALWLETNDWVDEADGGDGEVMDQAMQQRDSVGEKLEAAHAERDAAVAALQSLIDDVRQMAAFVRQPPAPSQGSSHGPARSWIAKIKGSKSA